MATAAASCSLAAAILMGGDRLLLVKAGLLGFWRLVLYWADARQASSTAAVNSGLVQAGMVITRSMRESRLRFACRTLNRARSRRMANHARAQNRHNRLIRVLNSSARLLQPPPNVSGSACRDKRSKLVLWRFRVPPTTSAMA